MEGLISTGPTRLVYGYYNFFYLFIWYNLFYLKLPTFLALVIFCSANSSRKLASVVRGEKSTEDGGGVLCSADNSSWETKMEKRGKTAWITYDKSSKEDT